MAEIQRFSYEKATKETLKALALGLRVEKEVLKPATMSLKDILGYYFSLEMSKILKRGHERIEGGFQSAGIIFQRTSNGIIN